MADQTFLCPKCGTSIPLTEALNARATQVAEERLASDRANLRKQLEQEFADKMTTAVKKASVQAQEEARKQQGIELRDLENRLKERDRQLEQARDQELQLRTKTRQLEEAKANWELQKARELDAEKDKIRQVERQALQDSLKRNEEEHRRKEKEQATQIEIMQKTIEDLRRQAQQGSQQVQGEAQEHDLKQLLSMQFPSDEISDVPTGALGADLVQKLGAKVGATQGIIVWESKNTKQFSEGWLDKLKKDQGTVKADVAVLVTQVLPADIERFGQRKGVWICSPQYALALAMVLRSHLLELQRVKASLEGQDHKMTALYQYLSSSAFQNRMEQLVLAFIGLKEDLDSEKRALTTRWSKREKQIEHMMLTTAGFYGDMQGIIGGALPTIPQLELDSAETSPQIAAGGLFE